LLLKAWWARPTGATTSVTTASGARRACGATLKLIKRDLATRHCGGGVERRARGTLLIALSARGHINLFFDYARRLGFRLFNLGGLGLFSLGGLGLLSLGSLGLLSLGSLGLLSLGSLSCLNFRGLGLGGFNLLSLGRLRLLSLRGRRGRLSRLSIFWRHSLRLSGRFGRCRGFWRDGFFNLADLAISEVGVDASRASHLQLLAQVQKVCVLNTKLIC
jgi:hypothetical protein